MIRLEISPDVVNLPVCAWAIFGAIGASGRPLDMEDLTQLVPVSASLEVDDILAWTDALQLLVDRDLVRRVVLIDRYAYRLTVTGKIVISAYNVDPRRAVA